MFSRLAPAVTATVVAVALLSCGDREIPSAPTATPTQPAPTPAMPIATQPTPTPTPTPATPTVSPIITFRQSGTVVRDNPGMPPGVWVLVYEAPGAPALTAELAFTSASVCTSAGATVRCADLGVGDRVRVEGERVGSTVRVVTLEIERGGQSSGG